MTFESRRVTLNGGRRQLQVFVADDRPNALRSTNSDEFHCCPRQSLHCIEFCRTRGDAHVRACSGDSHAREWTCSSDILCFIGEVAMFVLPSLGAGARGRSNLVFLFQDSLRDSAPRHVLDAGRDVLPCDRQ
jgi:hypothetical protein